jgi:hypothetical protein
LLFAKEDSFEVDTLVHVLRNKPHLDILTFDAAHGFMDYFPKSFDLGQTNGAEKSISHFPTDHIE